MNMNEIMKQAQQFQQKMGRMQEELGRKTVTATVAGGMVSATVNGRHEVLSIAIDKEIINPDDPVMLQDLVAAAVNEAMRQVQVMVQTEMGKLTGGINIPGLF